MVGTTQAGFIVALLAVGCFFLTVGTVGLLRFPNVYNRMHATSKPTTLGTAAIFLAGYVRFGPGADGLPSLLGIAFLFITVPTGAHMIARSAERMGVPFLEGVTWPATPGEIDGPEGDVADGTAGTDGSNAEGVTGNTASGTGDAGSGTDADATGGTTDGER